MKLTNEQREMLRAEVTRAKRARINALMESCCVPTKHDENAGKGNWMACDQPGSYEPARH